MSQTVNITDTLMERAEVERLCKGYFQLCHQVLTALVEFKYTVRVHSDFYPFERALLHLFEVKYIVAGGTVTVGIEMKIISG